MADVALSNLQAAVAKLATDVAALVAKSQGSVADADVQAQADAVTAIDATVTPLIG